jgi:hypothetical protein
MISVARLAWKVDERIEKELYEVATGSLRIPRGGRNSLTRAREQQG